MLFAIHGVYPSLRPYTAPFFQLSHYRPESGLYVQGLDDISFVITSILSFTAVRAIAIDWLLRPLARRAGLKRKASIRFAEQGWLVIHHFASWSYGLVCLIYIYAICISSCLLCDEVGIHIWKGTHSLT